MYRLLLTDYLPRIYSKISDKIKLKFFQVIAVSVLLYGCTTRRKSLMGIIQGCCVPFKTNPESAPPGTAAVRPFASHLTNHPSKMNKMLGTAEEALAHGHVSVGQPANTYNHRLSADTGWTTQMWWMIEMDVERESMKFVQSACLLVDVVVVVVVDDDDDDDFTLNFLFCKKIFLS